MATNLASAHAARKMKNESMKKATAARNKRKKEAEKNWGWYTKAVKKTKRANAKRNNANKH